MPPNYSLLRLSPAALFLGSTLGGVPLHIGDPAGRLYYTVRGSSLVKFAVFLPSFLMGPVIFYLVAKYATSPSCKIPNGKS